MEFPGSAFTDTFHVGFAVIMTDKSVKWLWKNTKSTKITIFQAMKLSACEHNLKIQVK